MKKSVVHIFFLRVERYPLSAVTLKAGETSVKITLPSLHYNLEISSSRKQKRQDTEVQTIQI